MDIIKEMKIKEVRFSNGQSENGKYTLHSFPVFEESVGLYDSTKDAVIHMDNSIATVHSPTGEVLGEVVRSVAREELNPKDTHVVAWLPEITTDGYVKLTF